jgi:hypothetical protein
MAATHSKVLEIHGATQSKCWKSMAAIPNSCLLAVKVVCGMFPCRWPLEGGAEEALNQAHGQSFRANAERGARPLAMYPTHP